MLADEALIRVTLFALVFLLMATWEAVAPRRQRLFSRLQRWPANLAVSFIDTAVVRGLLPTTAVGIATIAEQRAWGLLNNMAISRVAAAVISVIILDFAIYLQHVMFHAVPVLWRVHRMHHADLDFDVSTGVRFHPIEILLSMLFKLAVIVALGAPPVGVFVFEVLLNATSMFNHANVSLPEQVDRYLRWFIVTPDMHRVHHSVIVNETNSNFGFNLPWWDRLLGTYRPQPEAGHQKMTIGIEQFRDPSELQLHRMLLQPFRGEVGTYAITWKGAA